MKIKCFAIFGFVLSVAMARLMAGGVVVTEAASAPSLSNPVEATYAAIWDGFYGTGKGKLLLKASPAILPNGQPAFEIDEKTDEISFTENADTIIISIPRTLDSLPILDRYRNGLDSFEVVNGTMDDAFIAITGKEIRE